MGQTLFTLTCLWNSQTAGVHSMGVWRHVTATFSQCIKSLPRNRMCVWKLVRKQGKMGKINELSSYKIVFGSAFKVSIPGWDFSLQKYFPLVNAEKNYLSHSDGAHFQKDKQFVCVQKCNLSTAKHSKTVEFVNLQNSNYALFIHSYM